MLKDNICKVLPLRRWCHGLHLWLMYFGLSGFLLRGVLIPITLNQSLLRYKKPLPAKGAAYVIDTDDQYCYTVKLCDPACFTYRGGTSFFFLAFALQEHPVYRKLYKTIIQAP